MNAKYSKVKTTIEESPAAIDAQILQILERIATPVGTFAGTPDRIIRVRNGKIVSADTGDQGSGQN
jgi:ABC-type sulfate transport system substrate-binding protein